MPLLTASLVVFRTPSDELLPLFAALAGEPDLAWVVVDNAAGEDASAAASLRTLVEQHGGRYVPSENHGFGAGHNLALRTLANTPSTFHLLVNPDITFAPGVLAELVRALQTHPEAGWVMPKVLYPDGRSQPLCKLLPTPLDFAIRRFLPGPLQKLATRRIQRYELTGIEDAPSACVPFLSGCFALVRRDVFTRINGFDERYFLYMEDVDLCRRFSARAQLLYWPRVSVVHGFHRGSHRNWRLTLEHLRSSWHYFNRWGWVFDRRRRHANQAALADLERIRASKREG
jgi:hypothetical protein